MTLQVEKIVAEIERMRRTPGKTGLWTSGMRVHSTSAATVKLVFQHPYFHNEIKLRYGNKIDARLKRLGAERVKYLDDPDAFAQREPAKAPPTDAAVAPSTPTAVKAEKIQQPSNTLLVPASSITPEPISWLWSGWLAAGKLHILAGIAGTGKTTIGTDFAAIVSAGLAWPDGTVAPVGDAAYWSGEDGINDTVIPRLAAAGADLQRVQIIGAENARPFNPSNDMAELEAAIIARAGAIRLLVLDPLVAVVGAVDSHKNAETRAALAPLAELARRTGVAIVGIHHLSKGTTGRDPTERLSGSLAFGAVARVVMITAQTQGEDAAMGDRVLMRAKSNIGADSGGFRYSIIERAVPSSPSILATTVQWGATIEGRARDVLADAESQAGGGRGGAAMKDAIDFLRDALAGGPVAVPVLQAAAAGAGMSWTTIRRAKALIRVLVLKSGMDGGWTWALPSG